VRLLLTTIILTLLVQPVWAKTVYFCETLGFAQISLDNEVLNLRPYRFKMAVTSETVEFSGDDFLPELKFNKVTILEDGEFFAGTDWGGMPVASGKFSPPKLKVAISMYDTPMAFTAHCEDF